MRLLYKGIKIFHIKYTQKFNLEMLIHLMMSALVFGEKQIISIQQPKIQHCWSLFVIIVQNSSIIQIIHEDYNYLSLRCMGFPLWFFALYSRKTSGNPYLKLLDFPTFGCGYPYEICFSKNLVHTLPEHCWDTQQNFLFNFIIFLQTLKTYLKFFLNFVNFLKRFFGPPSLWTPVN